jgi:DNA-binding transcriptional ArsR family regulator
MEERDVCEGICLHEEKVARVKADLEAHAFREAAERFKVLADETRLKIAYALCGEDELCVCDIAGIIGSTVATASHHLRLLRNMGMAKSRRDGKLVYYSLADPQLKRLIRLTVDRQEEAIAVE